MSADLADRVAVVSAADPGLMHHRPGEPCRPCEAFRGLAAALAVVAA